MVTRLREFGLMDFENPKYYNIRWMKTLEEAERIIQLTGSVFEAPAKPRPKVSVVARGG